MIEILLNTTSFSELKKIAQMLEKQGIEPILVPNKKKASVSSHLLVEVHDLPIAKKILKGKKFKSQSILFSTLDNKPGVMAELANKLAAKGINLTYVFATEVSHNKFYLLINSSNNKKALEIVSKN